MRIFTPIDDGVKYCTKGSNLYDSPLLEIGLIAGIKEVHKKSITWIEWDYVGQLLVTADCTGCVGLWRLEVGIGKFPMSNIQILSDPSEYRK